MPYVDNVTISDQAKELAKMDAMRFKEPPSGSRALAYGELIYGGPPWMSFEKVSAKMSLLEKYADSYHMASFKKEP